MNQQVEISLKQIYEDIYQVSFPNGDFYKGRVEFEYNQENENPNFNTPILHGFGEMFYHNGEIYQGEFKKIKKMVMDSSKLVLEILKDPLKKIHFMD